MPKIYKIIFLLLSFFVSCCFFDVVFAKNLSTAFNSDITKASANKMGFGVVGGPQPEDVVGIIISSVLGFLGVIFGILIVYGGFLWMTAGGNDQEIDKAKKIIKNASIGLFVVLLSYSLSWLVLNIFVSPGPNINN